VGLVEADPDVPEDADRLQKALPEYQVYPVAGGMLVLSRFEMESTRSLKIEQGGRVNIMNLSLPKRPLTVAVVDMESSPFYDRGKVIEGVFAESMRESSAASIVMGDFNTPRSSAHFDPIRSKWRHAFETSGCGWIETWPFFLPLLAIDHIWLQGDIRSARCRHGLSWCSDHQSVTADLTFTP
jgi:endonuclease/exonuclease/phosphatase family metal-dependent hydrolase